MIAKKYPFNATNQAALIMKILNQPYEPLPEKTPKIFKTLIKNMLEKNVDKRATLTKILNSKLFNTKLEEMGMKHLLPRMKRKSTKEPQDETNDDSRKESVMLSPADSVNGFMKKNMEISKINAQKLEYGDKIKKTAAVLKPKKYSLGDLSAKGQKNKIRSEVSSEKKVYKTKNENFFGETPLIKKEEKKKEKKKSVNIFEMDTKECFRDVIGILEQHNEIANKKVLVTEQEEATDVLTGPVVFNGEEHNFDIEEFDSNNSYAEQEDSFEDGIQEEKKEFDEDKSEGSTEEVVFVKSGMGFNSNIDTAKATCIELVGRELFEKLYAQYLKLPNENEAAEYADFLGGVKKSLGSKSREVIL